MALVFCDGFDSYAQTTDIYAKWQTITAPWAWANNAGRLGHGGLQATTATGAIFGGIQPLPSFSYGVGTYQGYAFWIKISALPTSSAVLFAPYTAGTGLSFWVNSSTGFLEQRSGGVLSFTCSVNICDNNWHWIEHKSAESSGSLIDNWVDANHYSGSPTNNNYGRNNNGVAFYSLAGATVSIDDFFMVDANTPNPQVSGMPFGMQQIVTKRPASNASPLQFTPDSGSNYARVNEVVADGDTSYVQAGTSGNIDQYNYSALGFNPAAIQAVQYIQTVRNPGAGQISFKGRCTSGGTTSDTAARLCPPNYFSFRSVFNQDPHTSAAWTQPNLDAATFGPGVP